MILTFFATQIFLRFNRYMVECESKNNQTETNARELVLIDTWWNVNFQLLKYQQMLQTF